MSEANPPCAPAPLRLNLKIKTNPYPRFTFRFSRSLYPKFAHQRLSMDSSTVGLVISVIALLVALFVYFQTKSWKEDKPPEDSFTTRPLQLQAYERLVLLCERISLPSLISRVSQPGLSAREMQMFLIESIKQEYEYNISQQVYVSTIAWDAVRNLRDQNMLIINQIASILPADAKASDLNKQLLEVLMNQQDHVLHSIVLETLNFEAKQLMK